MRREGRSTRHTKTGTALVIAPLEHDGQRFQPDGQTILRKVRHCHLTQHVANELVKTMDGFYDSAPIEMIAEGTRILRLWNAARG